MAAHVGFSATTTRESRQARKGATVAIMSGAGEVPAWAASSALGERAVIGEGRTADGDSMVGALGAEFVRRRHAATVV